MRAGRPFVWGVVLALLLFRQSGFAGVDAVHRAQVIPWAPGASSTVSMRSTDRLPEARGTVMVEREGGTTAIEIELDSMKPASLFGGDYNTYVLWVVPPGGPAENLGEVLLDGDRARLKASTAAESFAILVSAEPHLLVTAPSAFIVLDNKPSPNGEMVDQPLIEGRYHFSRSSLNNAKEAKVKVHTDVKQAFTAFRLAQRAGAATLARDELAEARRALDKTISLWRERKDRTEIAAQARETIRLAVAAQHLAQERALQGTHDELEGVGRGDRESEGREARDISSHWR